MSFSCTSAVPYPEVDNFTDLIACNLQNHLKENSSLNLHMSAISCPDSGQLEFSSSTLQSISERLVPNFIELMGNSFWDRSHCNTFIWNRKAKNCVCTRITVAANCTVPDCTKPVRRSAGCCSFPHHNLCLVSWNLFVVQRERRHMKRRRQKSGRRFDSLSRRNKWNKISRRNKTS